MPKDNSAFEKLQQKLEKELLDIEKSKLISKFLSTQNNFITLDQLNSLISNLEPCYKPQIIQDFLKNKNNPHAKIYTEELASTIDDFEFYCSDGDISKIIQAFLENENNIHAQINLETLRGLIKSFGEDFSDNNRSLIIQAFLGNKSNSNARITLKTLKDFTKGLSNNSRSLITQVFLKNENNIHARITLETLESLIESFGEDFSDNNSSLIIQAFLENENNTHARITLETLEGLIESFGADFSYNNRSLIIQAFLKNKSNPNTQINLEELMVLIESFGENFGCDEPLIIQAFLENENNLNAKITLKELLGLIKSPSDNSGFLIIQAFLKNKSNPNTQINLEELVVLIESFGENFDYYYGYSLTIQAFLENENNIHAQITLKKLGQLTKGLGDNSRSRIIQAFLENENNLNAQITLKKLEQLTKGLSDNNSSLIIQGFLKNENNIHAQINLETLRGLIESFGEDFSDNNRSRIIQAFLKNENNIHAQINLETLRGFIESFGEDFSDNNSSLIIQAFLKNENNIHAQITLKELEEFTKGLSDNNGSLIIQAFLKNKNNIHAQITLKELEEFTKGLSDNNRSLIIQAFLENESNPNARITLNELKKIIDIFKDQRDKFDIINSFVKVGNLDNDQFIRLIDISSFKHDELGLVSDIFLKFRKKNPKTLRAKNTYILDSKDLDSLSYISQNLYHLEDYRLLFLYRCFTKMNFKVNKRDLNCVKFIRNIMNSFGDVELVGDLISKIADDQETIMSLVKDRFISKYPYILQGFRDFNKAYHLDNDLSVEKYLTEEGVATVKEEIGNKLTIYGEPITILDLLSYYEVMYLGGLSEFNKMLRPEVKEFIRNNFKPSDKSIWVGKEEVDKFKVIFGLNEINLKLITVEDFVNKLKNLSDTNVAEQRIDVLQEIKNIDLSKGVEINFKGYIEETNVVNAENNVVSNQKNKQQISDLFNRLIAEKKVPNQNDVGHLFGLIAGLGDEETGRNFFDTIEGYQKKLAIFFHNNKQELAYFFTKFGVQELNMESLSHAIKDQCANNIGDHFHSILYAKIFEGNAKKRILYETLREAVNDILNKSDGDVIFNYKDSLSNPRVLGEYLSADALLHRISEKISDVLLDKQSFYSVAEVFLDMDAVGKDFKEMLGNGDEDLIDNNLSKLAYSDTIKLIVLEILNQFDEKIVGKIEWKPTAVKISNEKNPSTNISIAATTQMVGNQDDQTLGRS